jgi:hypothetical protein
MSRPIGLPRLAAFLSFPFLAFPDFRSGSECHFENEDEGPAGRRRSEGEDEDDQAAGYIFVI